MTYLRRCQLLTPTKASTRRIRADYGVWVPGIPVLVGRRPRSGHPQLPDWLSGLIHDGIVAGVGAVLGFVPQMLILFVMLCASSRPAATWPVSRSLWTAFSARFGLSGKTFIPMLIGSGCGVPGVMAVPHH